MALQAARLPARVDDAGELVLLEDQDRVALGRTSDRVGVRAISNAARRAPR